MHQGKWQKNGLKNFKKNVKVRSPNFWKNYFFLESYNIGLSENDDSTHDSKYTRNYILPNFMWCQKNVLCVTVLKWNDRLPIF